MEKTYKVYYYQYGNKCASASFVLVQGNTFSDAENNFMMKYSSERVIIVKIELLNPIQYVK